MSLNTDINKQPQPPLYAELDRLRAENALLASRLAGGAGLIAHERRRQIDEEGFDVKHDEQCTAEELACAGVCYALSMIHSTSPDVGMGFDIIHRLWPLGWDGWWKPKDPKQDLVRAGALIAAALDRLQAEENQPITNSQQSNSTGV